LRAGEETARVLGDRKSAAEYHALFLRGQQTYVSRLWNGEYFRYDTGSESKDDIQTDQLAGQWYANLTGLGDIVPRAMQDSAMKKIFDFNVMKLGNGEMGAANGMAPDGSILTNAEAREVWVGTTESFAGLLMSEGLKSEAWKTTWGLYHVIYETRGYWFRTPEAWDFTGNFRAGMYMRPMAIWALEMTPARSKAPE
jgi:non-lysosomal glucosylceramidase